MTITTERTDRLQSVMQRLIKMSKEDYYNPYEIFEWPESLPEDQFWMTPELMATHGTEVAKDFTQEQLWRISRWESVNFYSLNVDGIRDLITEIIARIHTDDFALTSEYFHYLVGEENEHMWFFARFCLNYGHLYPDKGITLASPEHDEAAHFLTFAKLMIFEEIVDFYNQKMGDDERLHPTIRQVNAIHHQDESRHIAFGRQIVGMLYEQLRERVDEAALREVEAYLKRYIRKSMDSFVNPAVYKDAGIPEPYKVRSAVLADPAFRALEQKVLKRPMSFFVNEKIFLDATLPESV